MAEAADILVRAAELNSSDSRRCGNVIHLSGDCDMIVTGDLHGNSSGLAKIIDYADLGLNPSRRLILQELIHGPPDAETGRDRSIETLLRAAKLKTEYPNQVVFLLGNHDISQITGNEITRGGQPSCKTFTAALDFTFQQDAGRVFDAFERFVLSLPLAIKCPNGVLISHSLPSGKAPIVVS